MRRIVYLSKGGNIGGAHRQLLYLLTGLRPSYEPVVVCSGDGDLVAQLRSAGVPVEVISLCPWRKMPRGLLRYRDAERLVRVVRQYDPALIHCSDMWLGNYLAWLKWRLKTPAIVHVRAPLGVWDVYRHRLRAANGLISISQRITRTLTRARIVAGRIAQIEDGVDTDRFSPRANAPSVLPGNESGTGVVNIGLVGRIEPAKQQLHFIQAASKVAIALPGKARFFLIGEVRDPDYFRAIKDVADRSGFARQLVFTGRREDMPDVLRSLDILVSLSGGSVMYEAMSRGLCVVSAGFSGKRDSMHLRDGITGVVMTGRDSAALADRLVHLISHPEVRAGLGAAARQWAQANLSFRTMAAKTVNFYDRLLCGGEGAGG